MNFKKSTKNIEKQNFGKSTQNTWKYMQNEYERYRAKPDEKLSHCI